MLKKSYNVFLTHQHQRKRKSEKDGEETPILREINKTFQIKCTVKPYLDMSESNK